MNFGLVILAWFYFVQCFVCFFILCLDMPDKGNGRIIKTKKQFLIWLIPFIWAYWWVEILVKDILIPTFKEFSKLP